MFSQACATDFIYLSRMETNIYIYTLPNLYIQIDKK